MSIADFNNNSFGMSVKGRRVKFRKPPHQGGSDTFLSHKITAEHTDHTVSSPSQVLRSFLTSPTP